MTTHTKNKIMDYLQWSHDEYEGFVFLTYWLWCKEHGKFESMIQQLVANAQVNAWFLTEYAKREAKCIMALEATNYTLAEMTTIYKVSMNLLLNIYPSALMEDIKRNRDFSNAIMNSKLAYYAN
jgi:hypothetical protein